MHLRNDVILGIFLQLKSGPNTGNLVLKSKAFANQKGVGPPSVVRLRWHVVPNTEQLCDSKQSGEAIMH